MIGRTSVSGILAAACLALMGQAAAAELSIPDCKALVDWANTYHPSRGQEITPRVILSNLFADDLSASVFGKRAVDWNADEYRAVNSAMNDCMKDYRKAKQKQPVQALKTARAQFGRSLRRVQAHFARLQKRYENIRRKLLRGPATAATYRQLADADTPEEIAARYRLPDASGDELAAIAQEVVEYRETLRNAALEQAAQDIAGLPEAPRSLIELNRLVGEVVAAYDDRPERADLASLEQTAQARRSAIRAKLLAASGEQAPMLFPECPAFFTWAAAADLQRPIQTGRGAFSAALMDDTLVPVFGRPLEQWTDEELALFREGMQGCMQLASRSRSRGAPDPAVQKVYMLAASLPSARAAIGQFKQAQHTLAEQRSRLETIAPTLAGVEQLRAMERDPALMALAPQERQAHVQRIRSRQRQIADNVIDEAVKELERFPADLKGLDDIGQYRNRVQAELQGVAGEGALQRFEAAFRRRDAAIASAALPAFKAKLSALPVAPESPKAAQQAVEQLVSLRQGGSAQGRPGFGWPSRAPFGAPDAPWTLAALPEYLLPYKDAAEDRVKEIEAALHAAACTKTMATVDLASKAARLQVLGPFGPTTLGDLVCRMVMTGHSFHAYDSPGVFGGGDHALKVTVNPGGYQTIVFHQGEVAPGTEMLVGKMVKDANVERPLAVQEWQTYASFLTGQTPETGMSILQQLLQSGSQ